MSPETLRHRKKKVVIKYLYNKKSRYGICRQTSFTSEGSAMLTEREDTLLETSNCKESLHDTKRRQNLRCSLDNVFDFFQLLDLKIRSLETNENVNLHGADIYDFIFL